MAMGPRMPEREPKWDTRTEVKANFNVVDFDFEVNSTTDRRTGLWCVTYSAASVAVSTTENQTVYFETKVDAEKVANRINANNVKVKQIQ